MKFRRFKAPSGATLRFSELGFGSAPVGNLYKALSNAEAEATLEAAWAAGIRYFDTAPLYGLGLSETRLNHFLYGRKRDGYLLSSKVGRTMHVCKPGERTAIGKFFKTPSRREQYDYSHDGIMRSFEASLERLGADRIDILLVHDLDVFTHKSAAKRDAYLNVLMTDGYRALRRLRDEKAVAVIGGGINEWQVCEMMLERGDFDVFLLAGRYTLLEQDALTTFLPLCEQRGVGIILGGPYNSGILATGAVKGATYDYDLAPKPILDRVDAIHAVCRKHKVKLPEAALRFPLHHPTVVSVVPGAASPAQVKLNLATLSKRLPANLWRDLKSEGLLHPAAPIKA
jgi:D-threo-aldose 1-dehydrogenase